MRICLMKNTTPIFDCCSDPVFCRLFVLHICVCTYVLPLAGGSI
jgi:hypothetical protein